MQAEDGTCQLATLSCVTARTVASTSGGPLAEARLADPAAFAVGDTGGSVYTVRRDIAADSHRIATIRPSWSSRKGGDDDITAEPTVVADLCWRGEVLIGANNKGRVVAWQIDEGSCRHWRVGARAAVGGGMPAVTRARMLLTPCARAAS